VAAEMLKRYFLFSIFHFPFSIEWLTAVERRFQERRNFYLEALNRFHFSPCAQGVGGQVTCSRISGPGYRFWDELSASGLDRGTVQGSQGQMLPTPGGFVCGLRIVFIFHVVRCG
jgi:hypothetical protein